MSCELSASVTATKYILIFFPNKLKFDISYELIHMKYLTLLTKKSHEILNLTFSKKKKKKKKIRMSSGGGMTGT